MAGACVRQSIALLHRKTTPRSKVLFSFQSKRTRRVNETEIGDRKCVRRRGLKKNSDGGGGARKRYLGEAEEGHM